VGVGSSRGAAGPLEELARVDALLDDPAFFKPFVPFFDPQMGRLSTPMETNLWLLFLKFPYRLGMRRCAGRCRIRSRDGGSDGSGWMRR
jgi:hypothetical protein